MYNARIMMYNLPVCVCVCGGRGGGGALHFFFDSYSVKVCSLWNHLKNFKYRLLSVTFSQKLKKILNN